LQNARLVDALVERGVERACAVDIGEGRWDPLDPLLTPAQRVFDNADTRGLLLGRWSWGKKGSVGAGEKRWAHGWFHHVGAWEEERNHYLGRLVDAVKEKVEADWVEKRDWGPDREAHWRGKPSSEEVEATFNSIFMALGDAEEEEDEEEEDEWDEEFRDVEEEFRHRWPWEEKEVEERFLGYNYFRVGDPLLAWFIAYKTVCGNDTDDIISFLESALEATISSSKLPDIAEVALGRDFTERGYSWHDSGFEVGHEQWDETESLPPEDESANLSDDNPPRYKKTIKMETDYNITDSFPFYLEETVTFGPFIYEKEFVDGEWTHSENEDDEDYYPEQTYRLIKKK
jgi:hypothetical protein